MINTQTFTLPCREADLIISLVNGGSGGPYDDDEIASANEFIKTFGLKSLVDASEPIDGAIKCTFAVGEPEPEPVEWAWMLFGAERKRLYEAFGLMPARESMEPGNEAKMLPLTSPPHKDAFLERKSGEYPPGTVITVVRNIESKLFLWWKSAPDHVRRAFSVLPSFEQSWEKYDLSTRMNIYNYCIVNENGIPRTEEEELSLLGEISTELADVALESIYNKPIEDMCDDQRCFLEKYQEEFNRLKDEIEDSICAIEFKK